MIHNIALSQPNRATLLLDGRDVRRTLERAALLEAIEAAFVRFDRGEIALGPTLHIAGEGGGFHAKSAFARVAPRRAAMKLNGNFPDNPRRHGLPTVQGFVALVDLERGTLLALVDSIAVTALRTAAVSAMAARRLARRNSRVLSLIGCGVQAREHLVFMKSLFPLAAARLVDRERGAAEALAREAAALGLSVECAGSPREAAAGADIVVTSTPSRVALLDADDVGPGTFVAAVGADNPEKNEIAPALLARSRVVVDSLDAARAGGDLRAALEAGVMTERDVHGELPALVSGRLPGREDDRSITVFDSTGLGVADWAAANLAYEAARGAADARLLCFSAPEDAALAASHTS